MDNTNQFPRLSEVDSAYLAAALACDMPALARSIRDGADINVIDPARGANALTLAAKTKGEGSATMAHHLLDIGVRADVREKSGTTAAHRMANAHLNEGLARVLAAGLDPDAATLTVGLTPLHMACAAGNLDGVAILLRAGADATLADSDGHTPLHYAVLAKMVDILLDSGAMLEARDGEGRTPLGIAIQEGAPIEVIERLVAKGADVDNGGDLKPIHIAAMKGRQDALSLLLAAGADLDSTTCDGKSVQDLLDECDMANRIKPVLSAYYEKQAVHAAGASTARAERQQRRPELRLVT